MPLSSRNLDLAATRPSHGTISSAFQSHTTKPHHIATKRGGPTCRQPCSGTCRSWPGGLHTGDAASRVSRACRLSGPVHVETAETGVRWGREPPVPSEPSRRGLARTSVESMAATKVKTEKRLPKSLHLCPSLMKSLQS
jgi:hypothetical protein